MTTSYLFGAYSPCSGNHFTLELPHCNTDCFQIWMEQFAAKQPEVFKIVILDNGAFHKSKPLTVPPNIALLFLPPYSPELNPAEMIWKYLKIQIANRTFKDIENLSEQVAKCINNLNQNIIKSIIAWNIYKSII